MELKTNENDVMVSSIVARNDNKALNDKGMEVNRILRNYCNELDLHFIDNSNVIPEMHLNNSRLHLNDRGTYRLGSNFVTAIMVWLNTCTSYSSSQNKKTLDKEKLFYGVNNTRKCNSEKFLVDGMDTSNQNTSETLEENTSKKTSDLSIAHININSIYNKFEALYSFVSEKIDILIIY